MTDLAKPLADGGWRDIITAPKDGTEILLGRFVPGDKYHGRIRVDWWRSTAARQGFTGFGEFNTSYWPATHWHLLPAPPGAATSPDADRVAVLVEVLKPFAQVGDVYDYYIEEACPQDLTFPTPGKASRFGDGPPAITLEPGDFLRARAALATVEGK